MTEVYVKVIPTTPKNLLNEDDRYVEGTYAVELQREVLSDMFADTALDCFHSEIAIKCLEDFEFKVVDTSGSELLGNPDHDSYSFEGFGSVLYKV